MLKSFLIGLSLCLFCAVPLAGQGFSFKEDFALSGDRAGILKQLVPGTRDYYYYYCLFHQGRGELEQVEGLLGQWRQRHGRTTRCREIERRQALLKYANTPAVTLAFLQRELLLKFDHLRERGSNRPDLATTLDQDLISRKVLLAEALKGNRNTLQGLTDRALDWLVADWRQLDEARRRCLLGRLDRPDHPQLVDLVLADLNTKHSRGFGSHGIHRQLLLGQLRECGQRKPELRRQSAFIHTLLNRLRPGPDEDWQHDPAVKKAYLSRLWQEVEGLDPAFNSLKAHVLYHRLVLDQREGVYDAGRFLAYIKLPRYAFYMKREYLRSVGGGAERVNLSANFGDCTPMPRVGNDGKLVHDYLLHFFATARDWQTYSPYLRDTYLKSTFAEAKLTLGVGDMEQWYSLISPGQVEALKNRVDLAFASTNKNVFGPGEVVTLDLQVKNVKRLIVKVYEINTENYYRKYGHAVTTDIKLDGLVPGLEQVYDYKEPPLRRCRRSFTFPTMAGRGVYVIDFIGNGKNSRALIRQGGYCFRVRDSVAGHVFTLLDEKGQRLGGASLLLEGQEYKADEAGLVAVPYTTNAGKRNFTICAHGFAALGEFQHKQENYKLQAGFYVDRESLLQRRQASLLVSPQLRVNSAPASLGVLQDVVLELVTQDLSGVVAKQKVEGFKLFADRESLHKFRVPPRVSKVSFRLTAKVINQSRGGKKENLSANFSIQLNQGDKKSIVEDLHLLRRPTGYLLEVRGKTGEPRKDRPVGLFFKHRDFKRTVRVSLKTDQEGRIDLGALAGVEVIGVQSAEKTRRVWALSGDQCSWPKVIHGKAGQAIEIPIMDTRGGFSLLARLNGVFVADCRTACRVEKGMLVIRDLPAGNYDLWLKKPGKRIQIRLAPGEFDDNYLSGPVRQLEICNPDPLQIISVQQTEKELRVKLKGADPVTRVHILATRYLAEGGGYSLFNLATNLPGSPEVVFPGVQESFYLEGRDIGDEYRYIINRKYAEKHPGNMLKRPGLLLNPWPVRTTVTGRQDASGGISFGRAGGRSGRRSRGGARAQKGSSSNGGNTNLDFLGEQAVVLANIKPGKDGMVVVPLKMLGNHGLVRLLALNPQNRIYREVAISTPDMGFLDLRLSTGLAAKKHFTEQKEITPLRKGEQFVLSDLGTGKMEFYDSLAKVYRLYTALGGNRILAEFSFLIKWPTFDEKEKSKLYSEYACHELSFFLFKKDPAFFKVHVQPLLANKMDKTFMDHYLLGDDLNRYLEPWAYGRLNVVERILLSQRNKAESEQTKRHLKDTLALLPPNVERFNFLFDTAVSLGGLEGGDKQGLRAAQDKKMNERSWASPSSPRRPRAIEKPNGRGRAKGLPAKKARVMDKMELEEESELMERGVELDDSPASSKSKKKSRLRKNNLVRQEKDMRMRESQRQLYRKLDKTREWAENNYYHLTIDKQNADLVKVNSFWRDYAFYGNDGPFLSRNLAEASGNFTEMALALAVLDLPFTPGQHKKEMRKSGYELIPASPGVVFHQEIKPTVASEHKLPILVSQNFFNPGDRYRYVNGEKVEKYVTGEFLVHQVYGCHVVVTNPASARHKLELLLQIPMGAMPVKNSKYTATFHVDLKPYRTYTRDIYFYFPAPGEFAHFPVHASKNGKLAAAGKPVNLTAVKKLSKVDQTSWQWVSQNADADQVIGFLQQHNINRLKLEKVAWRMADKTTFKQVIELLRRRHVYNHTLWSYGIYHQDTGVINEYLQHHNGFVAGCGPHLVSPLLAIDPVIRKNYEHLEYSPLVNARAHRLGKSRKILNGRLRGQYNRLLNILCYQPELDDTGRMALTYYLLLQDRVSEAQQFFAKVDRRKIAAQLQYDYFDAYLDFFTADPSSARQIAEQYKDYPVARWRQVFAAILAQLDEIEGKAVRVVDNQDRTQQQTRLAATQPGLEMKASGQGITLSYQNLNQCRVDYFPIDIELLFSRNPFVSSGLGKAGEFTLIKPCYTTQVTLPAIKVGATGEHVVALPRQFAGKNLMVMAAAGGITRSQALFAGSLSVQVIEKYGRLRVARDKSGKPLVGAYVKVYAKLKNGTVRFYKDGYTDHRGLFDYTSLSNNEQDNTSRFAIMILSEKHGAVVREASPPR